MKKKIIPVALLLLSAFSFQSCIGNFSLTNKVLAWNQHVNNKFVNEVVFFAFWVLPVYEVTALADLLVINSIEFWSGNNPLEASQKTIDTEHGVYYLLADENGYKVTTPDGNVMNFEFDKESNSWNFSFNGGDKTEFLRHIDDNHVQVKNSIGEFVDVELSRDGVDSYIQSTQGGMFALN